MFDLFELVNFNRTSAGREPATRYSTSSVVLQVLMRNVVEALFVHVLPGARQVVALLFWIFPSRLGPDQRGPGGWGI